MSKRLSLISKSTLNISMFIYNKYIDITCAFPIEMKCINEINRLLYLFVIGAAFLYYTKTYFSSALFRNLVSEH
jgi:hypothetical protein